MWLGVDILLLLLDLEEIFIEGLLCWFCYDYILIGKFFVNS